jgi:hypothetical protein
MYGARPFATDDAGTVPAAGYELEVGYDFWEDEGTFGIGFKHGLTEKMDIGIGFGYNVITEPKRYFSGAELCLKYSFVPDMIAASFTTEFNASEYALNGIFTRGLGGLEIDANFGYSTADSSITFGLACIYVRERLGFGVECSGDDDGLERWLGGVRYDIVEGFAVDLGISGGFEENNGNVAMIGLHYEF